MADFHIDKPAAGEKPKSPVAPSPFYENDIEIPGIYIDRRKPESADKADESWRDNEDRRVKNSLINPPLQEPVTSFRLDEKKPLNYDFETRTEGSFISPAKSTPPVNLPAPISSKQRVKDIPDLKNPPPVNPMEDTPTFPNSYPQPVSDNTAAEEDLGVLRSQIVGAGNAPSLPERIQAASKRALELQRLGNTDTEVRSILERSSGLTPEQVGKILLDLEKPDERNRIGRLMLIFSILTIIVFILIAWWFLSSTGGEPDDQKPGPAVTVTTGSLPGQVIDPQSLPAPLQTLLPKGVRIFNDPPVVDVSTADILPSAPCPKSKMEAATTFGGPANDWNTEKQDQGWVLISQQQSLEIKVPANMTAGYLVFERGPEMRSVTGPVIVRNVYMISIACQ